LSYFCSKTINNSEDENFNNNIELVYITKTNRIKLHRNPDFSFIEYDLSNLSVVQICRKIKVYSEDEECRWFFKKLILSFSEKLEFLDIHLGWKNILRLYKGDFKYFSNNLIVLDGDAIIEFDEELKNINFQKQKNILFLPGGKRPESIFYEYLTNIDPDHDIFNSLQKDGFTQKHFIEHNPLTHPNYKNVGGEREKFKKWFNDYICFLDNANIFEYWRKDNACLVDDFINQFSNSYNYLATKLLIKRINEQ
jgi:hypothetical protein